MHDIDQTLTELEADTDEYESGELEFEEEGEDVDEVGEFEFERAWREDDAELEADSPFDETEEMELAAELMQIGDEAELDQFLGKLFKRAWRGLKRVGRRVARPLRGVLRRVARRALPFAGRALGGFFGGPAGALVGGRLARRARRVFGLELEGLSPEDQEFEVARRFVRLAGAAARRAAMTSPTVSPTTAVSSALVAAARRHAPGLVGSTPTTPMTAARPGGRGGRWIRRGRRIILLGV